MSAGYSKTPLVKKLGIKPGFRVWLLNAPPTYAEQLDDLPLDVTILTDESENGMFDLIHLFTTSRHELEMAFAALKTRLVSNGMLWISWPKKASKIPSDLTEEVLREVGLPQGLVDVKVIAVDEIWSGLKFVYRIKDRHTNNPEIGL